MLCATSLCFGTKPDADLVEPVPNLRKSVLSIESSSRALRIAAKIWKIDSNLGLTKTELIKACLFIEKKSRSMSEKTYYSKKEHGIPCTISKVPQRGYLISDLPHGHIGHGVHKIVSKAILYADEPKIVASCLCDDSGKFEVQILQKLHNCRGIVPFLGVIHHSHDKLELLLEFFPDGSLLSKLAKQFPFSHEQMLKIAKDAAQGLLAMHQRHYIHRDLHSGNILLRKNSNGMFDAALVDFGKAMLVSKATKKDVPQAPKTKNPPEMLIHSIQKLNRYSVDVYAFGANLYSLFWNKRLPWAKAFNPYRMRKMSYSERKETYRKIVADYVALKKKTLQSLLTKDSLTAHEQAQLLIFSMIDYSPSRRPTMAEVVSKLDELMP
jgi:hypothetical protein